MKHHFMYMIKEKNIYNSDYINVITLGQRIKDSKSNLGLVNWDKFDHIISDHIRSNVNMIMGNVIY